MLILCTANQCRSPMAEVLLRRHLERAGVTAQVSSAGLHPGGSPATDHGQATMAARGLDLTGHTSRQLTRELVDRADVVVGMAREHVREVAVLDRQALDRAFTLREIVALGEQVGPRGADEPLEDWLRRAAASRRRESLLGSGHDAAMDIEDPVGRGPDAYEATATELDHLLARLVAVAWPAEVRTPERAT